MRRIPFAAAGLLLLAASACDTVPIDKADASPPAVQVKLRKAEGYVNTTATKLGTEQLEIAAVAEDPNGVRSLRVDFLGTASDSCTVGSSVYGGTFSVAGLPKPLQQDLSGNAEGEVLTTLPLFLTIPPDLTCSQAGQKGRPIGHTFTVRATAKNWGQSDPVVATMKVTIQ